MSSEVAAPPVPRKSAKRRPRGKAQTSLLAHGEPMMWLTGGALALALAMIVGLLALVLAHGASTFWPGPLVQVRTVDGKSFLGEVASQETYVPSAVEAAGKPGASPPADAAASPASRLSLRIENYEVYGTEHFRWFKEAEIAQLSQPEWAMLFERQENGRFYAFPKGFAVDGKPTASTPAGAWEQFQQHHAHDRRVWHERDTLTRHTLGQIKQAENEARIRMLGAGMKHGKASPQYEAAERDYQQAQARAEEQTLEVKERIDQLDAALDRHRLLVATAEGREFAFRTADIVRAYPANQLDWFGRLGVYSSRWWEFLSGEPRHANSEGGVFPAIFGTVVMTLVMSLAVMPFGVLAALYLREYAKSGLAVSAVRVAINNLAGVPSVVFGVFGMGFFCYVVGEQIDLWFFPVQKAAGNPTFGKGALVWASLTLALLTLPVVIVATEEALSAVPNSLREGSYACGGSRWQTIRRIVLPRALPGIMTGLILAMARGAGEVAPLMLVGVVNEAPALPFDWRPPFGLNRSFMHLGFQIYDVGFQSQNSEAAKPMVFTITLLLIAIVAVLNVAAVWLRNRLRRKYVSAAF